MAIDIRSIPHGLLWGEECFSESEASRRWRKRIGLRLIGPTSIYADCIIYDLSYQKR